MEGLILSAQELIDGAATLSNDGKLKPSQVEDLVSIFRIFLGNLSSRYSIKSTLEALQNDDLAGINTASKLAACLNRWKDNAFDVSGFAATATNKTGFYDSTPGENFEIFKYAFGLFWDLPEEIESRWTKTSGGGFGQGHFQRVV